MKLKTKSSGNPYTSRQLIAYIGNKRRLLPLIKKAVKNCLGNINKDHTFTDFFAGSGSVSKLAKLMGFNVISNDWETYSSILNSAFLETNQDDLNDMFKNHGGIKVLLKKLNSLRNPSENEKYISKYYCPKNTKTADPDEERLFYTKENGCRIDAIREWIDINYPLDKINDTEKKERKLLLGLLIYEAATHSNTSGVFKAYHRGYGGRGKDALSRIMSRIELEYPELINGSAKTYNMDASRLAEKLRDEKQNITIAYLDPPYNQHQYGSNYHLLNTIALNDKPAINSKFFINGKKVSKSGIRKDWINTKSNYCYKEKALKSFENLIETIEADHILISYSTEGIIPFNKMLEILGKKGKLDITLSSYTRYPGGKQALTSTVKNIEFVLMVNTKKINTEKDTMRIYKTLNLEKMKILLDKTISPEALINEGFLVSDVKKIHENLVFSKQLDKKNTVVIEISDFKRIRSCYLISGNKKESLNAISEDNFKTLITCLKRLTSITREEELQVTLYMINYLNEMKLMEAMLTKLPELQHLIKKFNDKKAYRISLLYILKILGILDRIKQGSGDLTDNNKFKRFLNNMQRIISLKLAVKNDTYEGSKEIRELKRRINLESQKLLNTN